MTSQQLKGIRILDLSMWWSGPICTSYLGAQGAEIIKVESIQAPDGFRYTSAPPGEENWWELGPQFNNANLNKLGITLNLNDESGVKIFEDLVAKSDVVLENFTPRVMDNFGLNYERLKEINPEIIMISMPAYGKTGPFSDQPGFAYTFEILSGLAQVNGYENENPMIISGIGDIISGFHACYSLLAALRYKQETNEGQYIEVAQVESNMNFMGQPIADFSLNNRNWERTGNKHQNMAPHGIYRCKGEDEWVAIAISDETDWQKFCEITSNKEMLKDSRFNTLVNRKENEDALNKLVEQWTMQKESIEVETLLQKEGLPAGTVVEVEDLENDPFLKGMFQKIARELTGTHAYHGWPLKVSGERLKHNRPAPLLGEHNDYVLKNILDYSDKRVSDLEKKQVIGNIPVTELN